MWLEIFWGIFIALIIWDTLKKRRQHRMIQQAGIPGPTPLPILGNILEFVGNTPSEFFKLTEKWKDVYGKVVHMWIVSDSLIFIQDPQYFESILRSQKVITKNSLYDVVLSAWLGQGLLLSTGQKWFSRRKILTPAFHFKILDQFVEIFDQQGSIMAKRLLKKADGKTVVNMFPEVCLTALDIIAETAMGVRIQAQEHPEFKYAKSVTEAAELISQRIMRPFHRFDWYYRTFCRESYHKLEKNIKIMHDFTDKVIEERRKELQKSMDEGTFQVYQPNNADAVGLKKRMALLDVLLQSTVDGKPLSNQDIREEVDTFMFEGHDTTTSGIAYTCYLISRHPEVQQKLLEEFNEKLGTKLDEPVTMQQLQDLKYLECVIKESLRLYPPVPIIGRITEEDIEINGKMIPANTDLTLLIYAACRDGDYFAQPNEFRPERFLTTENAEKTNHFAYVPFSAGPRNCIGQKFAILEMKSTISKMVRHFELLPLGEEVKPVINLILRSSTGINVGLRPREY